jgi:hypothetical protein
MKLHDLFNEDSSEIAPGEKRALLSKISDLSKLKNKINDSEMFLNSLAFTQTPASRSLAAKFNDLKQEVENKISGLKAKLKMEKGSAISADPEVIELLEKIESECSDYVAAIRESKHILYRGSKHAPEAYLGRSWDERRAKDSNQRSQLVFDKVIARMGIKANRGNSIFCSPRESQASGYGKVYYIFPKNGFNFLYTDEDDLVMDSTFMNKFLDKASCADFIKKFDAWFSAEYPDHKNTTSFAIQELGRFLDGAKNDPQWYNPIQTVTSIDGIVSDPWYKINGIPGDLLLSNPDVYASLINLEKFERDINPKDSNLSEFLKTRRGEICISGIFYALSVERFEDLVVKRFAIDSNSPLTI